MLIMIENYNADLRPGVSFFLFPSDQEICFIISDTKFFPAVLADQSIASYADACQLEAQENVCVICCCSPRQVGRQHEVVLAPPQ